MALPVITDFVQLQPMNGPRTALCMEQVGRLARALGDETLVELAERALAASRLASRAIIDADRIAREMHRETCVVVAHIIAGWHDQPGALEMLLMPIAEQQARTRAVRRTRRAASTPGDVFSGFDPEDTVDESVDDG